VCGVVFLGGTVKPVMLQEENSARDAFTHLLYKPCDRSVCKIKNIVVIIATV